MITRDEAFMVMWNYRLYIQKVARRYSRANMSVEDIFQDITCRHVNHLAKASDDPTHAAKILQMYIFKWICGSVRAMQHTRIQYKDGKKLIAIREDLLCFESNDLDDVQYVGREKISDDACNALIQKEEMEIVMNELQHVNPALKEIFLDRLAGKTLCDIGKKHNISKERVRQKILKVTRQIRKNIEEKKSNKEKKQ